MLVVLDVTVYVDEFPAGWGKWTGGGHLTTTDIDELHELAAKIGLRREWFQDKTFPHYDVQRRKRQLAIAAGAVPREMLSPHDPATLVKKRDGGYETYGERMDRTRVRR